VAVARTIAATIHGRYLVDAPSSGEQGLAGILIGCHGYAEAAEAQLARLQEIPGLDGWARVSIQALHRFYRGRSEEVVASWMTRQDRELMIADTVAYVSSVVAEVSAKASPEARLVFAGFSQGVATAFRAACASAVPCAVVTLGGDIPPEIDSRSLAWLRRVLIGRGTRDEWYTAEKYVSDVARLHEAGTPAQELTFDAGHEWTAEFSEAVGRFLRRLDHPA
jgi:predicted esterase